MSTRRPLSPRAYLASAVAFLVVGFAMGLAVSSSLSGNFRFLAPAGTSVVNAAAPLSGSLESPFVDIVQHSLPAVVLIESRRSGTRTRSNDDDAMDLFRRMFPERGRPDGSPSSGSGFIIDRNGRILTNNHVVANANTIKVTLADKRTFDARVVGLDPATDVAVIQIQGSGSDFPVLPLGNSDGIRVGDWAIAIGNPLGELQGSVTAGIISAKGRSSLNIMGGGPDYQDFIQTDASINFGNSGGPLMNIRGEVIGINTAINAAGQGIGFAIPINLARRVAEQLVSSGKVVRGYIGVLPGELTPDLAESFGLSSTDGVVVSQVVPNSPAARAGIQEGDVVTSFDGKKVRDVTDFRLKVADAPVERRVPVEILRDGRARTVYVTLANRETSLAAQEGTAPGAGGGSGGGAGGEDRLLGLDVRAPNQDEAADFENERGVIVQDVAGGSPAEGRVEPGEMILQVNGQPVRNPREFSAAVRQASGSGRPVRMLVGTPTRNGMVTRFVAMRPESR